MQQKYRLKCITNQLICIIKLLTQTNSDINYLIGFLEGAKYRDLLFSLCPMWLQDHARNRWSSFLAMEKFAFEYF
jgi:hypothetical protein